MPANEHTEESAHDVLAAEAFAVPAPEVRRHRGKVVLPEDPTGDPAPHDVLAAEAFAGPVPRPSGLPPTTPRSTARSLFPLLGVVLLLYLIRSRRA